MNQWRNIRDLLFEQTVAVRRALISPAAFAALLSVASETNASDYVYVVENERVTITRHIGSNSIVWIPETIEGFPVVEIGPYAFLGQTNVTEVTIPDSVRELGKSAFRDCANLESVNLPRLLGSISDHTFEGCTSLSSIDLPSGVGKIGRNAFFNCANLANISIPEYVNTIE